MKPARCIVMTSALFAAVSFPLGGDPLPQPPVDLRCGLMGTFNADWQGVAGRTYFVQRSPDFINWYYMPYVGFGDGNQGFGMDRPSARLYMRVAWDDRSTVHSLDEAMGADFDEDGLTNIFEVTYGYDPYHANSTADGPDADIDPDGDGLSNVSEKIMWTDPMMKDNPIVQLEVTVQ